MEVLYYRTNMVDEMFTLTSEVALRALFSALTVGYLRACGSCAAGDAQENDQRPVEPKDAGVIKHPDLHAEPGAAHGSDLVHHDPAGSVQAVALIRLDQQPEQRSVRRVGGERAQRDRIRIEVIILDDHRGPRFAGVIGSARDRPDLGSPHGSGHSDTESTKAWSSSAASLAATARDCRCASAAKPSALT